MSRTAVNLDDSLLAQAEQLAARTNRSVPEVIEDALRESFARECGQARAAGTLLPTCGGGWVRPGVSIDSSACLVEIMEAQDDPA